jgi:hypothetical protein
VEKTDVVVIDEARLVGDPKRTAENNPVLSEFIKF